MKRGVKVRYQKAGSTPSSRQKRSQGLTEASQESRLTPLARYVAENEDSGIPVWVLVEQFQELDCMHLRTRISANSPSAQFITCDDCGKTTRVEK